MRDDPPFDVWNGVDLDTAEDIEADAVEEVAMHLDPESEVAPESEPAWSELTDEAEVVLVDAPPVRYFEDEQPEASAPGTGADDDRELDLEELLERQHYAFKAPAAQRRNGRG